MKKLLFFTLALVLGVSANAQKGSFYLGLNNISLWGGTDGIGTGVAFQSQGDYSATAYGIAPEIGYYVSNKVVVGAVLGIGGVSVKDANDNPFSFEISPYVRYFLHQIGNFGFYLQGGIDFAQLSYGDAKETNWGIGILPGVAYSLSNHFSLTASFGELGYASSKLDSAADATNTFGLRLDASTLKFGLAYKF
jgi:hypothetical protein